MLSGEFIHSKLGTVYPGQEPKHWATVIRYSDGGPDPLDGISAYRVETPQPHWSYVTFGFSELGLKSSPDPDVSGWGFEMIFRLAKGQENEAPEWPVMMLQKLARYVFNTNNPFEDEHYIRMGGPITGGDPETELEAFLFGNDPLLGELMTPNGKVVFLNAIGITSDQHADAEQEGPAHVLAEIRRTNPLGITALEPQ